MADPDWSTTDSVDEPATADAAGAIPPLLRQALVGAHSFSFAQLVLLLELERDRPGTGGQGPASEEHIRIRPTPSMAFPAADLDYLERLPANQDREFPTYRLNVNFMGLYGPASPLPAFFTESVMAAENEEGESNRRDFLDYFNQRLLAFVYRSWKKYRYYIQYQLGARDIYSGYVFSLVGLGDERLRTSDNIVWPRLLAFAGLLGARSRSAAVLANVLSYYFDSPARITECVPRQVTIEPDQRNSVGLDNCSLGSDLCLGERVWDVNGKCMVHFGPLSFARFSELLPIGRAQRALYELVRLTLVDRLDFDMELTLRQDEVPAMVLGPSSPCRLGWSTWLGVVDNDGVVSFSGEPREF